MDLLKYYRRYVFIYETEINMHTCRWSAFVAAKPLRNTDINAPRLNDMLIGFKEEAKKVQSNT